MSDDALNLAAPLRAAITGNTAMAALLATWQSEPAVHTRRPAPPGSGYPMAMVSPDVSITDTDLLVDNMPVVVRDLAFYGQEPGDYRNVEQLAYLARRLFHNRRFAITVPGYHVVQITARGPMPAPTDDVNLVGRMVSLTIQLQELP